jgi:hypothetical protein
MSVTAAKRDAKATACSAGIELFRKEDADRVGAFVRTIQMTVTRGFTGKQREKTEAERLPPGQALTNDFPVLSAGPTPQVKLENWSFTLKHGPQVIALELE